jgi:anthranilate synthase component 2
MFGVCLGLQAMGQAFGGDVVRAPEAHAWQDLDHPHEGRASSAASTARFAATRYHSLVVAASRAPTDLEITAETEDGLVMGLSHRSAAVHGVQFHPESIASEHGHRILEPSSTSRPNGSASTTATAARLSAGPHQSRR